MMRIPSDSVDQILSVSWDRKLADDLALELEMYTGEKRSTIEEMRRFLAIKGCRELSTALIEARRDKMSWDALKAVAIATRAYALQRPGVSAAAFRTPASDFPEWHEAYQQLREFMLSLFAECGLYCGAADQALHILISLVRGFVLNELMCSFLQVYSYDEAYEHAIDVLLVGLRSIESSSRLRRPGRKGSGSRRSVRRLRRSGKSIKKGNPFVCRVCSATRRG